MENGLANLDTLTDSSVVTKNTHICNNIVDSEVMISIHAEVEKKIKAKGRGSIILPNDFKVLDNPDAVKMALSRLAKEQVILRLAQGIYLYPKIDPELGTLVPSIEEVAKALAKRDRVKITPSGIQAMHMLGFTTQVPMQVVYLTDGSPRKIKVGKRTITFKRKSPKQMALKGKYSSLVIQGLQELGMDNVTKAIKDLSKAALEKENAELLRHDMMIAPEWVAKILRELMIDKNQN